MLKRFHIEECNAVPVDLWADTRSWDNASEVCLSVHLSNYFCYHWYQEELTHWGRVTHICVSKLTIIVSDNGLSPGRRQAIIWTNVGILLIGPLGTNFNEILIKFHTFSLKKMRLKRSSAKWRPFCLSLIVLMRWAPPPSACLHTSGIVTTTQN